MSRPANDNREADILVRDYGTMWGFTGLTPAAQSFLTDEVESESWQWTGQTLVVDHRPARALLGHIADETALTFDVV